MILVATGMFFLFLSIKPAIAICKQDRYLGWKFLLLLIISFFLGYLFILYYLYSANDTSFVEKILSVILFGGGVFVTMVINFSLKSIRNSQQIADKERYNALHDALTGLPNRKYFLNTVVEKIQQATPFSVLVIDINGFKPINDMIGHYFADYLLIKVATAINQQLPQKCFFARVGGDEFTVLSSAVTEQEIAALNLKIHQALKTPFNINGNHLKISVSIGGSIFPNCSEQIVPLLQQAYIAMYAAKKKQVEYLLYNASLDNDNKYRLEISSKLYSALEQNEFEVHYQPLIKTKGSQVHHFEALIRWPQATGGFIPPDKFIPIAEQSGFIRQITRCVLSNIVEDLQKFKQAGIEACIHINLSARDLQDKEFSSHLAALLKQRRILAEQLVLEVTETAILTDIMATKEVLLQLARQGFLISLDDFGTGFSSLSILRELPIHQIKIDRSFVAAMAEGNTNHSIVCSIIFLAHNLNCTVVAEGVETKELVDQLIALQCDYLQGYYYSKPLPVALLVDFCKQKTA